MMKQNRNTFTNIFKCLIATIPLAHSYELNIQSELNQMLNDSHRIKATYYDYLVSIEQANLNRTYGYPSWYLTLSPYIHYYDRQSSDQSSSGGIAGIKQDLLRARRTSSRLMRNIAHALQGVKDGTDATYEQITKTEYDYSEYDLGVSQTLFDFGAQSASNRSADLSAKNSKLRYISQKDQSLLTGLSTYIRITESRNIILFANRLLHTIEDDIKKMQKNKNSSLNKTDLSKAKSTIASIESLIAKEKDNLSEAISSYHYHFGHNPKSISNLKLIAIPFDKMPKDMKSMLKAVESKNISLQLSRNNIKSSKENYNASWARQFPNITGRLDSTVSYDASNMDEQDENWTFTLSANYSTNFLSNHYSVKSAKLSILRDQESYKDLLDETIKQSKGIWGALIYSKEKLESERKALEEGNEFITKANKEYLAGKRSFLDILYAKTQLLYLGINMIKTHDRVTLQAYQALSLINSLNPKDIENKPDSSTLLLNKFFPPNKQADKILDQTMKQIVSDQ